MEKQISLELSEKEVQALYQLLDAAVKAVGVKAAPAATAFITKIEEAKKIVCRKDPDSSPS